MIRAVHSPAVAMLAAFVFSASAWAQTPSQAANTDSRARDAFVWLGGGLVGLAIHESGHVLTAASLGAHPSVRGIKTGALPFFAISHDAVGARKEYGISAAGFWTQGASVEWILHERPHLGDERAPFLKGVFAFHLVTSAIYGVAGFASVGPVERDTRGMAQSIGRTGIPERAIGGLVLAPAALDLYRYWKPDSAWAKWASRGAKIVLVGLVLAADRN